jgi:3-deoxy-D-manno-octulosonic-acid transferase
MPYLVNLVYLLALALASPWRVYRAQTTGRYRRGLAAKLLGRVPPPDTTKPVVWFHGVSVGEIHLLRQLVGQFRERRPDCQCVVSTTTDTGFDEATKAFPDLPVIDWPFDFTWAVKNALKRIRPQLVVLSEGEIWPNFVQIAHSLRVRVALVNARMSPTSAARYRRVGPLVRRVFARFDLVLAQDDEYARHYAALGAPRVVVTGNVKYDGVQGDRANARTRALAGLLGIDAAAPALVAGSTQAPEEEIALATYAKAREQHPALRLIIVPRHRERFDEVATLLERSGIPFSRRSQLVNPPPDAVILADTMGELGALWGLADVAFVGGSLDGKRGGQNMIEPAAYGAAVLFGPHTWNFRETVTQLLARSAAIQVPDAAVLEREVLRLLADANARRKLGTAAATFVRSQQGATARTVELLAPLVPADAAGRRAA